MTDAKNVDNGGMGRRISEVGDLIEAMTIVDPTAMQDFVGKLSAERGWSREYAGRVFAEYRRFLLMGWMSPVMVVPSADVDHAWHLHLTYTRHYWEELCGRILGKPFHHDPSSGSVEDAGRHDDHYGKTLRLYRYLFDADAPNDIWPRNLPECDFGQGSMVAASPGTVTLSALGIAVATVAYALGSPVAAGLAATVGAFGLMGAIFGSKNRDVADADPRRTYDGTSRRRPEKHAASTTRRGGSTVASSGDATGTDAAAGFVLWSEATPAQSNEAGGHLDGHATGASGGHGGHSCGGHSCGGHSCGGGGCGGGGD